MFVSIAMKLTQFTMQKIYGQLYLGSVRTLLGGFQIVAALDLLVDWANTDYRTWLEAVFE